MTAQPVPELRLSWYWPGAAAVECAGLEAVLAFVWGLQRFAESSVGTVGSSLCSLAVSVHIWLQVPASKRGGLQGEENGDFHKNTGFAVFSLDGLVFPLCLFHVQVLLSHIFARWGEESGVSMGVESQCMGLENTNVVFLPLQISNVDSADKSRKEVSREKINRRM